MCTARIAVDVLIYTLQWCLLYLYTFSLGKLDIFADFVEEVGADVCGRFYSFSSRLCMTKAVSVKLNRVTNISFV